MRLFAQYRVSEVRQILSERLGFEQRYAIADGSDRDALGVSPDFQPSARPAG